jgi:hypothetical protein
LNEYYAGEYGIGKYAYLLAKGVASIFVPIGELGRYRKDLFRQEKVDLFYNGVALNNAPMSSVIASAHGFNIFGMKPFRETEDGFNFIFVNGRPYQYLPRLWRVFTRRRVQGPGVINEVDTELAMVNRADSQFSFESELYKWKKGEVLHLKRAGKIEVVSPDTIDNLVRQSSGRLTAVYR